MVEFLPLFPKETVSRLSLHSSDLGTYHYDIKLVATQAAQERSVHFKTALGSSITQVVRLLNYCRGKSEFTCRIDNPDFFVEKPPVATPGTFSSSIFYQQATNSLMNVAGNGVLSTEFLVEVTFEPSKVGDAHTSLIARHDQQRAVILAALTDAPGAAQRHAEFLDAAPAQVRYGDHHHLLAGGLLVGRQHAGQARLGLGIEQFGAIDHATGQRRQLGLLREQAAGPEQQGQQQRKPARH